MDTEWKNDRSAYLVNDVRRLTTNLLPMILHRARQVPAGDGHGAAQKNMTLAGGADKPFWPTASVNVQTGDDRLAETVADYHVRMGAGDDPAIDLRPNWRLSMSKLNKSGKGAENDGN